MDLTIWSMPWLMLSSFFHLDLWLKKTSQEINFYDYLDIKWLCPEMARAEYLMQHEQCGIYKTMFLVFKSFFQTKKKLVNIHL